MMNFDSWMEDRINGDYGPELDRLDAQESFNLAPPKGEDSDEDSLGDQTTNGSSIEIELEVEENSLEEYFGILGIPRWKWA